MSDRVLFLVSVLLTGIACSGCQSVQKENGTAEQIDLAGRLSAAAGTSGDPGLMRIPVTRRGIRKDSIVLTAPLRLRVSLEGLSGPAIFECSAAPVFNTGDGFDLELVLIHGNQERAVHRHGFDAARRWEDRQWTTISEKLDLAGLPDEAFEIRLTAGKRGDLTADWLALAQPRIRKAGSGS